MVCNRFRFFMILRSVILLLSCVVLAFLLLRTDFIHLTVLTGLAIIYQTYAIIHLTEKTNRELTRFFQAMDFRDFTQSPSLRNLGPSFEDLADTVNRVKDGYVQLRSEKEEHYQYVQTVVQHVGVAVLSYREDGKIELINNAALRLFNVTQLTNIKSLESFDPDIVQALLSLKMGDRILLKINKGNQPLHLAVNAAGFKLKDELFKLVSIQNIQHEIERERMGRELEIARHVQQTLLPRNDPSLTGFDIAGICIPAKEVGGDYFDFIHYPDQRLGIVVGDVSGKGVPAAIYMTLTKGIIQSNAGEELSPVQILTNLNRIMYQTLEKNSFVTLAYALLHGNDRQIQVARAGHLPAIYFNGQQKTLEFLKPAGIGVGLAPAPVFDQELEIQTVNLESGDWFIFYTDGITEARNTLAGEYGEDRLLSCLQKNTDRSAREMVRAICRDVTGFSQSTEQHDDMTMVLIKVL